MKSAAIFLILLIISLLECDNKVEQRMYKLIHNKNIAASDTFTLKILKHSNDRALKYKLICEGRPCDEYDRNRALLEATSLSYKYNAPVYEAKNEEEVNSEIIIH